MGVDLLRQQNSSNYGPYVRKSTSPFIAFILSVVPGLGAAYNGQTVKALVYFGVFIGLFQLAILTGGSALFVLGFMGMWAFSALDAWRTARMIRAGVTPDVAEDILVKRFQGNPKLWGIVLSILGVAFVLQRVGNFPGIMRAVLPLLLIGLGIYILRGYIFKSKEEDPRKWSDFDSAKPAFFSGRLTGSSETGEFDYRSRETGQQRYGNWGNR